jgi:predicted dehydrogenase
MTGLRWGILSTGFIAETFVADLQANGFEVTAVGSRSAEKAQEFAERFGIPHAHGDYEALVADAEVDVVYVASPHPMHRDHAVLALNAGKHVLVEKAFTINESQAREVVELAETKGLIALEAMWSRWLPHMVRVREILASGGIGEVRSVLADHTQSLPSDPEHRVQNLELGGGALLDLGIYVVSFAWDMLGAPTSVHAISTPTPTGADARTSIVLGFDGDHKQAVLHAALDMAGPNTASVVGSEGWITIDRVFYDATSFTHYASDGSVLEHYESDLVGRGMQYQAWELERLVEEGHRPGDVLPPSETVAIMGTLDEVRRQIGLRYPGE